MDIEVKTTTVYGQSTAIGSSGALTLVTGRDGLGFNGGQLLYLAVAACVSNDLYREAPALGIALSRVEVTARGAFTGDPAVSTEVTYDVTIAGDAPDDRLRELVAHVDAIAEIPNTLRAGASVTLGHTTVDPA